MANNIKLKSHDVWVCNCHFTLITVAYVIICIESARSIVYRKLRRRRRRVTWPTSAANQRCHWCPCFGHLPRSAAWRWAALSRRRLTTSAMCLVELVLSRRFASHLRSCATLSWHSVANAAASAPSTYGWSRCSSNHTRRIVTARAGSGLERPPELHTVTTSAFQQYR